MVLRGPLLVLLLAWVCFLLTEGGLEVTQCNSSSQSTLQDLHKIRTLYGPSVITCSSLCIGDPACVSYIFSNNLCSLYSNNSEVATAAPVKQLMCQRRNQTSSNTTTAIPGTSTVVPTTTLPPNLVGCPQQIDNSTFQCLPLSAPASTCTCVSTKSMDWNSASVFCQQYRMALVAAPTLAKHLHINKLLTTYVTDTTVRLWTSGKRLNQTYSSFVWASTNVTLPDPRSSGAFWLSGQPDNPLSTMACVDYKFGNASTGWLYEDRVCADPTLRVICEYPF